MLKKLLSISFMLIMTIGIYAQSIPSGTARYEALGYNPFIMDASIDINRNPAWSGMYRNYAFGDIGRADGVNDDFELADQYAGVNFAVGKKMTLGLVLNKVESSWSSFQDPRVSQDPDSLGINAPIVPTKVLFSYAASKKLMLGISPYYAMWSNDQIATTSSNTAETKWSSYTVGGNIGVIDQMKNSWIELAVDLKMNKFKRVVTNSSPSTSETIDNTGGLELGAFVRGWFMVNKPNKINFVPYVSFTMFNWQPEDITSPTANTTGQSQVNTFNLNGGIGLNMPVLEDGMLAGGLSVIYSSYKNTVSNNPAIQNTSIKINDFTFPQFNVGMEWNFTDWLTGRLGYSRGVIHDDQTYGQNGGNTQEYTQALETNPDQTITTGLGFHFVRFSIEGTIGEKFWQRGVYLISGHATDMFGILSASYNFNRK